MAKARFEDLSSYVVNTYAELESDILVNIANSIKGKNDLLSTDPEAWKLQNLENLGMLYKDNLQLVKKAANMSSAELNKILINTGLETLNATDAQMQKAVQDGAYLLKVLPPEQSPLIVNMLRAYENNAKNVLNLTNQTLIHHSKQAHIDIINKAAIKASTGFITSEQALRSVIGEWAEKGLPALVDKGGRRWGTEGYVRTVLMSTANNISNELQDARIEEYGIDLIEVSKHAGDRPGCAPYAGRIFSLKPNHPKYPYLYDPAIGRIGAADSLFGINCGHMKFPFIEGISTRRNYPSTDPKQDKLVYEQSQQQRAIERSIRKAKTRLRMMEALGDQQGIKQAKQLVAARQGKMRKFIKTTSRTRRYDREQIVDPNKYKPKLNTNAELAKAMKKKPVLPTATPKQKPTPKQPQQSKLPTIEEVNSYKFIQRGHKDIVRDTEMIAKLPSTKQRAVTTYSGGSYSEINRHLRLGSDIDDRLKRTIDRLKEVIPEAALPLSEDIIFRRNMNKYAVEPIFGKDIGDLTKQIFDEVSIENNLQLLRKKVANAVVDDKGFVSTTYGEDMNNFKSFKGIEYRIYAKKGSKHGMFIESVSNYKSEREYLMNAGQKFRVFDVTLEKGGDQNILFHVIPI